MLPADEGSTTRAGRLAASSWFRRVVSVVAVLATVVGLSLAVPANALGRIVPGSDLAIDEPVITQKPGSAQPTANRVHISAGGTDRPEGEILFTTVAVDSDVSVFDWLESVVDDDIEMRPREEVFGTLSVEENRERNLEMMRVSKDTAVIAALSHLGIPVIEETGVAFEGVVDGGPVDGLLVPGDVIVGIDGAPITSFASLRAELDEKVPGEPGVITVENIDTGETRDVDMVWGTHPDPEVGGAFIGIESVVPRQVELPLPFDVEIDSGRIGGPSAGLAFTLSIIDLLTEGELTGGARIAVTGTIAPDGTVGNVGGVGQKAAAAHEAGAAVFIVPTASVDVAREHARGMPVIGVDTLDDALDALASMGGQTDDLVLIEGLDAP
jgi:PDZ domain-containing protein